MRVLHISTYDAHGGAARAASRLLRGLKREGDTHSLLVKSPSGDNFETIIAAKFKFRPLLRKYLYDALRAVCRKVWPKKSPLGAFSVPPADFISADLAAAVAAFRPDIVHLHWICNDFISLPDLRRLVGIPVVCTLHDSWLFTGGCHVPGDCHRFHDACGRCPALGETSERDLSQTLHKKKQLTLAALNLTVVAPSRWMAQNAFASSMLKGRRIEVIPNGLETNRYLPIAPEVARDILGLPREKLIILSGGMGATTDPNKGFSILVEALEGMTGDLAENEGVMLALFGENEGTALPSLPIPVINLGFLRDDSTLALAYSAADVMVVPSRQESFCQTAAESMACGTPVVAFRTSGLLDVIDHKADGYLADPFDPADLRRGILWATDSARKISLGRQARLKAINKFSLDVVAAGYRKIYQSILKSGA